jgi:NAD+ synthase
MIKNKDFQELVKEVGNIQSFSSEKAQEIINNIRKITKQYVIENNLKSLVLGVSGGLDSAVVAAICQEKYIGVPLIGISIPMNSTNDHKEKAKWVGKTFCSVFEEFEEWDNDIRVPLGNTEEDGYMVGDEPKKVYDYIFDLLEKTNSIAERAGFTTEEFPKNILKGNMKARIRMITLYDMARKTNGMVLSTGQRSEDEFSNFFTLHGDVGDFSPIFSICKGFELPIFAINLELRDDIINQAPSDGLMVTNENTDEKQLGANYKEIDTIMNIYLNILPISKENQKKLNTKMFHIMNNNLEGSEKIKKVIQRYEKFKFKMTLPLNIQRKEINLN